MSKKVNVIFEKEYLTLLKDLSNINDKILVKKTDDEEYIEIESKNAQTTVAYILKAPMDNFNFSGDEVGFYKFSEFSELLNAFEEPKLKQDDSKFEINEGKSKITYYTADPEAIPPVFKKMEFEDPEITFTLTEEEFSNLKKMCSLLQAETISFSIKNGKLKVGLLGEDKEDSSYEKEFEIDSLDTEDDVTLETPKDIFLLAPKGEYEVQIKEAGIVRFVYVNDSDYELELFTAENEDED